MPNYAQFLATLNLGDEEGGIRESNEGPKTGRVWHITTTLLHVCQE